MKLAVGVALGHFDHGLSPLGHDLEWVMLTVGLYNLPPHVQ